MQFYADIIKKSYGKFKIDTFCECVEILNLHGNDIKTFSLLCGFEDVNVYKYSKGIKRCKRK